MLTGRPINMPVGQRRSELSLCWWDGEKNTIKSLTDDHHRASSLPARPAYITQTMWLTPRVMMNVHGFAM